MKRRVHRVIRGGSFSDHTRDPRISDRNWGGPGYRFWSVGFRVVVVRRKP
jgi:formylglycine-generating enzyme required for sulfatase activity